MVQVAEALGWEWRRSSNTGRRCIYAPGTAPAWMQEPATGTEDLVGGDWEAVLAAMPPYGEDSPAGWRCTGPLIERLRPTLTWHYGEARWSAIPHNQFSHGAQWGATACEAVARLVVALGRERVAALLAREPKP